MLWIIGAVAAAATAAKVIYELATDEDEPAKPSSPPADHGRARRPPSTLRFNLNRLAHELAQESGPCIGILGQPGAGKSSLLRKLSNNEMMPAPIVGSHTDATDWSSARDVNLVSRWGNRRFVDVPGYDTASHPVADFVSSFPAGRFDTLILAVHNKLHGADEVMFKRIVGGGRKIIVVRTFADSLDESEDRATILKDLRARLQSSLEYPILFVSNRTDEGLDKLREELR